MKDGTCIKCGSREVHVGDDFWGQKGNYQSNTIPISFLSKAKLQNYVCTNCGYVESYVQEKSKLKKIKEKWPKVTSMRSR